MIATTIGNADAGYLIQLKNGNDYVTSRVLARRQSGFIRYLWWCVRR